ncbi:EscU/YscU/HrcU family type III secretion system export apparatus switch protein [Mesorhizobium atlanticum]
MGWAHLSKSLAKLGFAIAVLSFTLARSSQAARRHDHQPGLVRAGDTAASSSTYCWRALSSSGLIAVVDIVWIACPLARDLRMTKQEVKARAEASEGDPIVMPAVALAGARPGTQRMMAAVPRATL